MFELYATGEYSIERLEATMADLGLTTRPSGRWLGEQPVSTSKLHRMLSDPYYAGWVVVDGKLVAGRHPAIVSQALFDQVQEVLAVRSRGGNRDRVLHHYLTRKSNCEVAAGIDPACVGMCDQSVYAAGCSGRAWSVTCLPVICSSWLISVRSRRRWLTWVS